MILNYMPIVYEGQRSKVKVTGSNRSFFSFFSIPHTVLLRFSSNLKDILAKLLYICLYFCVEISGTTRDRARRENRDISIIAVKSSFFEIETSNKNDNICHEKFYFSSS